MDVLGDAARDSERQHHGHGPGSLDLAMELGLLETLDGIKAGLRAGELRPAIATLLLSVSKGGESVGNPADWRGYRAQTIAVWNGNAFSVFLGAGSGTGTAERKLVTVTANKLVVLPIEDEIYSVGAAAADLAANDARVFVARYRVALPAAAYAI